MGSQIRPSTAHPCSALDSPQSFRGGGPLAEPVGAAAPQVPSTPTRRRPRRTAGSRPSSIKLCYCLSLVPVSGESQRLAFPLPSFLRPQHPPPTPKRTATRPVREDPPPSGGCRRGVAGGCRPDPSTGSRGTRGLTCGAGARSSPPWAGAGGASSRLAAIRSGRPAPDRRARALDGEVSTGPRGSRSRAPPSPAPFLPTRRPPPRLKRQSRVSRAPTPPRARGARWERVL